MKMTDERYRQLTTFKGSNSKYRINYKLAKDYEIREIVEMWGLKWAIDDAELIENLIERSRRHCGDLAYEAVNRFMRFIAIDQEKKWIWLGKRNRTNDFQLIIKQAPIFLKVANFTKSKCTGDKAYVVSHMLFNGQLKEGQEVHHKNRWDRDRLHPDNLIALNAEEHKEFERTHAKIAIDFSIELKQIIDANPDIACEVEIASSKHSEEIPITKILDLCKKYVEIFQGSQQD